MLSIRKLIILIAFCSWQQAGFAQARMHLSGVVTDATTRQPIPYASVFLTTTMIGDRADENGVFDLKNIPAGTYNLTVTSVGYKTGNSAVDVTRDVADVHIELTQDVQQLKSVDVKTSKSEYLRQLAIFKEYFLGTTRNAWLCKIKNIDKVDFQFSPDHLQFTASCAEPVEVENEALGYRIFYQLESFKVDFATSRFGMSGYPLLQELKRPDTDEAKLLKKRNHTYYGSVNHFMRSLYQGKVAGNEFKMYILKKPAGNNNNPIDPSSPYFVPFSEKEYKALPQDSLVSLKIIYLASNQEYEYYKAIKSRPGQRILTMPQITIITFLRHGLVIHENGYFDDPSGFLMEGYMPWKSHVAELLPYEYKPSPDARMEARMKKLDKKDSLRRTQRTH